jgi:diguanylate cyclase (GGDEF)-like protein
MAGRPDHPDEGTSDPSWLRLTFLVLLLGLVATAVAVRVVNGRAQSASQQDVSVQADIVADTLVVGLEQAAANVDIMVEIASATWQSSDQYGELFDAVTTDLPGDSAAQTVLAIPPARLDAFMAAERMINPDLEVSRLNPSPPEIGHVVVVRGTDLGAPSSMADLSTFPGVVPMFSSVDIGEVRTFGVDFRQPTSAQVDGQLQRFISHEVIGPDGSSYRAWTIVQVDVQTLVSEIIGLSPSEYGLQVQATVNNGLADWGLGEQDTDTAATAMRSLDVLDFEVVLATDSRRFGPPIGTVIAVGVALTVLGTLIVAGAKLVQAAQRRASRSEQVARKDGLTGLPNRRWLLEHLEHTGDPVALLFCDLDRFKVVNDSAGHAVGDRLLCLVADRMTAALQGRHAVARFGGDEFLVVCNVADGESPEQVGAEVARNLVAVMAEPFDLGDTDFSTTLSVGIAFSDAENRLGSEELIRSADVALSHCKQGGRNGYVVYDRALQEADRDRLKLEQELRSALDGGELLVFYQPILDEQRRLVSYEALVRWERNGHLVSPAEFLPVVADLGRMPDLGRIVLGFAVPQLAAWRSDGEHPPELTMHVNVDPSQLGDTSFPTELQVLLDKHGVSPDGLVLELVEHEWIEAVERTGSVLARISRSGIRLAIDDFGSGYSSLGRLLDIDGLAELKLDRSIVARINEPSSRSLIAGFTTMASSIGIDLIAEGVETEGEFEQLCQIGITRFQGFLFARPLPPTQIVPDRRREEPRQRMASELDMSGAGRSG